MSKIDTALEYIKSLNQSEKEQINLILNSMINRTEYNKEHFTKELREMRFNKGKICPNCNSNHVVKNGKFNDKQRYLCKDCRKTYLSNYLGWYKYIQFFKNEKEQIKMKNLLLHSNLFYTNTKIENISNRLPNFI